MVFIDMIYAFVNQETALKAYDVAHRIGYRAYITNEWVDGMEFDWKVVIVGLCE
ncbi:hypothetical protein [Legionella sp.]|uniref:hypothetical protein n=1 Tax=Legionella sp. TaxID=459 RepID=UPI00325B1EEE